MPILCIFKHGHLFLTIIPSWSKLHLRQKSNQSQAIKFGPPTKKSDAIRIAKVKKSKQESIKKYVRTSKYFFCRVFAHLMLNLDENLNVVKKGTQSSKFFVVSFFFSLTC